MGNTHVARDYYGILGISTDAGPDEIKRAYRRLARELHPDVNPDAAAQERFAEVSAAYEVAVRPEKRRIVDLGGDPLGNGRGRPVVRRATRSARSASATSWKPSSVARVVAAGAGRAAGCSRGPTR